MSWAALFERAEVFEISREEIHSCKDETTKRSSDREGDGGKDNAALDDTETDDGNDESVRVVADAGVLAADLLVGGAARDALDHVRRHSWVELLASDELLEQAHWVIAELANSELADDWLETVETERVPVEHPPEDHPALASAYRGDARHLLTDDASLSDSTTNLALQSHMSLSVRTPDSFAHLFDPEPLYESLFEESYPGPDRERQE